MSAGYIYIMQHNQINKDWVKIGRTKNLNKRARSLAGSALMESFIVRAAYPCGDAKKAEAMVFRILSRYRIQGNREFFDAPIGEAENACAAVVRHIDLGEDLDPVLCFSDEYLEQIQNL